MPGFIMDFNRFCGKHIGYVILTLSMLLGSAATAATVYYLGLADVVSTVQERSLSTQSQLERHMSAEADYQREIRDLIRQQHNTMGMIQTDVAVLRERSERQ